MSDRMLPFEWRIVEKLLGFVLLLVGIVLAYYTYASQSVIESSFYYFFASAVMLAILGLLIVVVRN